MTTDDDFTAELKQRFIKSVHEWEFERTAAIVLIPIFLALTVMKIRRDSAERQKARAS